MPRKKTKPVTLEAGFAFRTVGAAAPAPASAKGSSAGKAKRGTKRGSSKSTTSAPKRQRTADKGTTSTKGHKGKGKATAAEKRAAARTAQMELIRQLVPPAQGTEFERLTLLLEKVVQRCVDQLHERDALGLVVDTAVAVGNDFISYLQQWVAREVAALREDFPPAIIPNPENQALRTRKAALSQLAAGFRAELQALSDRRAEVTAQAEALRAAPLPVGVGGGPPPTPSDLETQTAAELDALQSSLTEAGESLELGADAVQQLIVAADAAGARLGQLTTSVAAKARAEGFKAYDYVEKPQRLLKKMMAGVAATPAPASTAAAALAAAAGGGGDDDPIKAALQSAGDLV